ncbi:MAG: bifunctional folylpolyglutamate synthase/dihydrofolate synthase [Bacteroidales bacterium]|nr:bifunctional folylpolyglutamate synthase/dihydrofolate synthase [Bacteroidales bacterium]
MNYQETVQWLFAQLPMFQRTGKAAYKADLSNTISLLNLLDNPQKHFTAIHIAGTNGKGSVSHMIAAVLQEAGYKTALYTSPHLKDFRERIKINGQMIPEEKVVEFVEKHKSDFEQIQPSFFEMTVAMAYDYFKQEKVDFAVLETGMGGRLDSTNICNPAVSVVTNIGLDHQQFLGNTIELIAAEKAGIFKKDIPVIIGKKQLETKPVFEKTAQEKETRITYAGDHVEVKKIHTSKPMNLLVDIWLNDLLFIEELNSPLRGNYQLENIATAVQTILQLQSDGAIEISAEQIKEGIERTVEYTGLKGRWQILNTNPLTIADTGHNVDGMKSVIAQIRELNFRQLHFVLGMVSDKNHDAILQLLPKTAKYYYCKPDIPRGLDAEELKAKADELGLSGMTYSSVTHALASAVNNAHPEDLVFVGGSTFVVAEVV